MSKNLIYTIGHSTHPIGYFIQLLEKYGVNCLIDVRTVPSSSYNPQYNQYPFQAKLKENGIQYLHFAEEFGARRLDTDLLTPDGKVDFDKVRATWAFKHGLERLWQGIEKGFTIGLVCSEAEPLDCHRFSMVCPALISDGFQVSHILKDGSMMTNAELESEMIKQLEPKLPQPDIFTPEVTDEMRLKAAYKIISAQVAFSAAKYISKLDLDE